MTTDEVIKILVTVTLVEMMAAVGLSVTFADLLGAARNWRLAGRAALANYVCVPAAAVGLLLLVNPHPLVAAGFLILAVCPGAPYGPPLTAVARGNVPAAVGLMVVLAGSSALVAPLLLYALLPLVSADETLRIDGAGMVATLLVTQLVPLSAGMAVRQWRPKLAERLQRPANLLSKVLNLVTIGLILVVHFQLLAEIRPIGFVGMLALLVASWSAGWLFGGPGGDNRKAMTLTTSLRNAGVGLVIATGAFAGTAAVTATLAYGLFAVVGSLLLALWWGRREPAAHLPEGQAGPPELLAGGIAKGAES
jgi:bile acid:Na+ symporter, BASS family